MIYMQMGGRLGNQLFRYAAARSIQINLYPNEKLCFDFSYLDKEGRPEDGWVDGLSFYNVTDYETHSKGRIILHEGSIGQKLVAARYYLGLRKYSRYQMEEEYEYQLKWQNRLNKAGVYWYRTGYTEIGKSSAKDKLMSGCFEAPEYFNCIRPTLLDEFTPKYPELSTNFDLYSVAQEQESVCISIRRGDYETNQSIRALHSVCTRQYFLDAINYMRKKLSNPKFILFSDDIAWAKQNIVVPGISFYFEAGTDPVWEKLRLMSRCSHFIISNSSFSWWAQWLGTASDKIVVSPSRWYNNDFQSPLIDNTMVLI